MDRKSFIKELFNSSLDNLGVDVRLSFDLPDTLRDAFGLFDVTTKTLYINVDRNISKVRLIFTFYHEMRHAEQYLNHQKFCASIQESIQYVIHFNGDCYKLINNKWYPGKLIKTDIDYGDIYNSLPYEKDANRYAYKHTKKLIEKNDVKELDAIYKQSVSSRKIGISTLRKLFRQIDVLTGGK